MVATLNPQSRAARAWALATRQHGVVALFQLRALGYTVEAIRWRVTQGRLHRVRPGVYAVGRPNLTRRGQWTAAVLTCGPEAALSHETAAALWGIRDERTREIHVSMPPSVDHRQLGIRSHRRSTMHREDLTRRDNIPVTTPILTLIDLASRGGWTRSSLSASLIAASRGPAGIPVYWPDLGLVVETDGLRYHRTPQEQARDRLRDQAHTSAGLTPLRFTHRQVRYDPKHVERTLKTVARRLERYALAGRGS